MANETEIDTRIKDAVQKRFETARELRSELAAHPELSGAEFEASKKMAGILREAGFSVEYPFCGLETAFRASYGNGADGAAVAILAEYDALPEIGHGCGHNLHGALSLLAGLALRDLSDCFDGKLLVIGTPDEERDGGKVKMVEEGVFDNLDLAVMMHSSGGAVSRPNFDALALRNCTVRFTGKTAHAAMSPWEGHSALTALRKFLDLVDARRDCFTPDVRFNAIITEGGTAVNVIPESAKAIVEFRADSMRKLEHIDSMVRKCASGAALALECGVEWKKNHDDFADMIRVEALEDEIEDLFKARGMAAGPVDPPSASSDLGNVSYRCPAIQPFIAIMHEPCALHTREFASATLKPAADAALKNGAEIITALALKVFNDKEFRAKLKVDWKHQKQIKTGM